MVGDTRRKKWVEEEGRRNRDLWIHGEQKPPASFTDIHVLLGRNDPLSLLKVTRLENNF